MDNILFIGPFGCGKTSISHEFSLLLNKPLYPIDRIKWYFLFKNGYSFNKANKIVTEKGFLSVIEYYKSCFKTSDFLQIVEEFPNSIIEIPPYNIYHNNEIENQNMEKFLNKFENVFLLIPYEDKEETKELLKKRLLQRASEQKLDFAEEVENYIELNSWFLNHPINQHPNLKRIVVNDLKPKEVASMIIHNYF